MWYFTADWHLNHANIIKYCNRPFLSNEEKDLLNLANNGSIPLKSVNISLETVQKMNEAIISSTNDVAGVDDNLVIIGDFCWTSTPKNILKDFISRINCKNLYLIWGNHDNRQTFKPFFKSTYDQYLFHIEGQHIFVSHYPCKSWPRSSYQSWMLYGHVHNRFWHLDNGCFSKTEEEAIKKEITNFIFDDDQKNVLLNSLRNILRKPSFCLDVGVDNVRENIPFGTPWSFNEIKSYMERKVLNESF